jgi:hypothetical protein
VAGSLRFYGWRRSSVYTLAAGPGLTDGRLTGSVTLTLANQLPPNESVSQAMPFAIMGPGDVADLKPGAVVHTVPTPGTLDHEQDKCVHADLAAPDLPWRYSPVLATGRALLPWIVLVVGTPETVTLQPGQRVTLSGSAITEHDLARSARWAHVQEDADRPGVFTGRLVCDRPLQPLTSYVAVIVPGFTDLGQSAWTPATTSVTLPAYLSWQFSTGEAGDFAALAGRLTAGQAPSQLGQAPLSYPPVPGAATLQARGALAPIGSGDDGVPDEIAQDVQSLTTTPVDPRRPVIGMPPYGAAWADDPGSTAWGAPFQADPRARGDAGLGAWAGITEQDLIAEAAGAQAGALAIAAQRIRHLTLGLAAARSLWTRRTPQDDLRKMSLFGPGLRRMITATGTVRDAVAGPGRPLASALFSSSAARVLRFGPARTAQVPPPQRDSRAVLTSANTVPPLPDRAPGTLPHADALAADLNTRPLDPAIALGVKKSQVPGTDLDTLVQRFDRKGYSPALVTRFNTEVTTAISRVRADSAVPYFALLDILDPAGGIKRSEDQLSKALDTLKADHQPGPGTAADLLQLGSTLVTRPASRPSSPIDTDTAATSIAATIDPTAEQPFIAARVLSTITGLDDQPLAPPELSPDLDLPAWQFLRDNASDWLLPGADGLDQDAVVAVQTNPAFVDAFLVGLNTQALGELRFRNIPIVTAATPMRQFWSRVSADGTGYGDDILGVVGWPAGSELGSTAHQPAAVAASADLVLVMRTPLFRRYPRTLVYLVPAVITGGDPDWAADPDTTQRLLPIFQGTISTDITFFGFDLDPGLAAKHWVVLEEPSHGVRFYNTGPTPTASAAMAAATDGALFASAAFADPLRVLIRGDALVPGSAP